MPVRRLVSDGGCLVCKREDRTRRRLLNPETEKQAKAKFKARHPERVLQQARETYYRHKERTLEVHRQWFAKNPHKRREHEAARRAKAALTERYTAADVDRLLALQKHCCVYCQKSLRKKFHVDHIVPLSKGGSNGRDNVQLLCQTCNQKKFTKHPIDFARSLGRLL